MIREPAEIQLRVTAYDAPESTLLIDGLQAEYVARYGTPDEAPIDPGEFTAPSGIFLVGWQAGVPVACGGLRSMEPGVVELKRMYVVPAARRRGIARVVLRRLEGEAVGLGARELRLETGARQPEAIAMYEAAGYRPTRSYGFYANHELSHHLAKPLGPLGPLGQLGQLD